MPMLTHAGRLIVQPAEWTVEETGNDKLPTFICRFNAIFLFNAASQEWEDIQHEDASITGYFYMLKKDGTINKHSFDSVKAAFGWDGRSFESLANGPWNEKEVQITTDHEEYNGKTKLKVKWLNPRDFVPSGGALEPVNPQVIQSLDARYGAKLRALAGASPAAAPSKPAGPSAAQQVEDAKRSAWTAYQGLWAHHVAATPEDAPHRNDKWKSLVSASFGTKAESGAVSAAEWKSFTDRLLAQGINPPADDMPGTTEPVRASKRAPSSSPAPAMAMAGGGGDPEITDPNHPDFIPFAWSGRSTLPL